MRVLVTGASGFLGGFLVDALLAEGSEVIALVRRSSDLSQLRRAGCTLAYGNIEDPGSLRGAFQGVSAVFHLAGLVGNTRARSEELERVNVQGTANVIRLCQDLRVPRLIHVSSVAAVGAAAHPASVLDEGSANPLRSHRFPSYETKSRSEELVLEACRAGELDAVVVNPSVVVGAGDAKKAARRAQVKAARGELSFYPEGGMSVVATADVVQGIIQAWRKGRTGERYILSGENLTLREVLSLFSELAGAKPPRIRVPSWLLKTVGRLAVGSESAVSATLFHWYDHAKATKELGFQPRPAKDAIRDSIDWMEENGFLQDF